jgi:hypothetical protein
MRVHLKYAILWAIIAAFVVGLMMPLAAAQDKKGDKKADKKPRMLQKIMDDKLRFSQNLLAGIATANFKQIEANTDDLFALSKKAEWHVIKTPRYEMFSNEFQRACESILAKAKEKNIDGVTLSYFEMTMACVRCHQYVREVRDVNFMPEPVSAR